VTSIDIDEESIRALNASGSPVEYRLQNVLELNEEEKYDLVLALDVLEHIKEDELALSRIFHAMSKGAKFIVHVPNRIYQTATGEIHDVKDEDAWKHNPGHVRHGYVPEDLQAKLKRAGFTINRIYTAHGYLSDLAWRVFRYFESRLPCGFW
jgi:2-polyprenyl-3-methyl-5-hydroxy-6-metoxy-1,4-benzoquinol methylase